MTNVLLKNISFPIFKDDGIPYSKSLNSLQKQTIESFKQKLASKEYDFVPTQCLCGNRDKNLDIVVSEKDRYGLAIKTLLCKNCGLMRSEKVLDDYSIGEFYKNYYRSMYKGKEIASEEFFNQNIRRGEVFLERVKSLGLLDDVNNVFEMGCSSGALLYAFHKQNKKVSGCDFDVRYLSYGKSKGMALYEGEIDDAQTPDNSQDLIILSHVMEHFANPNDKINSLIRKISPEKYFLIEVPGIFTIEEDYFNTLVYFHVAHVFHYYK